MEPESSSPHSQKPTTCPYPEPDRASLRPPSNLSKIHFNIILPSTPGFSKWSPSLRFPQLKPCMHLSSPPYVPHVLPISVFLTWSSEWYLVRSREYKALCYVFFSTPMLPHPSWAQIFSSAPYSRKPSVYIPPSMWVTNFHNQSEMLSLFSSVYAAISISD
jgi:hypothetical protein